MSIGQDSIYLGLGTPRKDNVRIKKNTAEIKMGVEKQCINERPTFMSLSIGSNCLMAFFL
jgi:hypothetical protein